MKQLGFSLTEILLGLFLTSLMMVSLSQLYLIGKREFKKTEKLLDEHFELLWVSDLMSHSIRHAGFTPCLGLDQLKIVDERGLKKILPKISIGQAPYPIMHINRMSEHFFRIKEIISPIELIISNKQFLKANQKILIADCEHAEIHTIAKITKFLDSWVIVLSQPLFNHFEAITYLGEWMQEEWFVKSDSNKGGSLYYKLMDVEEVSALINSLTVNLKQGNQRLLVEVILGVNNQHSKKIVAGVRG